MNGHNETVYSVMRRCGLNWCGVTGFAGLTLIGGSGIRRLPKNPQSVISALFPYYTGEYPDANLSKYAIPPDYHTIAGKMLGEACEQLRGSFPDKDFVPFCDASPIPEVEAASRSGLGVRGRNGLLIHPVFGSYVFIGEIVTDLHLDPCEKPPEICISCGKCREACPAHALQNGSADRTLCLSAITQKKGELTAGQRELIKNGGLIWGCDVCQNVCPLNRNLRRTELSAFRENLKPDLTLEELDDPEFTPKNSDRAFLWKGPEVLKRNLRIIGGLQEDTNSKILKE